MWVSFEADNLMCEADLGLLVPEVAACVPNTDDPSIPCNSMASSATPSFYPRPH